MRPQKAIFATFCFPMLAWVGISVIGCAPTIDQEEYVTIGVLLPLTGESADAGHRGIDGILLAKSEINENGGVLGKKLDFIILNDRDDKEHVVRQYHVLKKKGVVAIIGSIYSDATRELAKVAAVDAMPVITPTASHPDITLGCENVFRAYFTDDYQGEVMATFAHESLNVKTAVTFRSRKNDSFAQAADATVKTFEKCGGKIVEVEHYDSERDFAAILEKYKDNPPDAIFCPNDYVPAARLIHDVYEAGMRDTYLLGSDAWDGLLVYVTNAESTKKVFYPVPFLFDDDTPIVAGFVQRFYTAFSHTPLTDAATAYTCAHIVSDAIKKAGNTNAADIISAMKENEPDTILGRIKFDENNSPRINVCIVQIKDGVCSTYKKINQR